MTWNELNTWSDTDLQDYAGIYGWSELEDDEQLDQEIWSCTLIDGFIEVLDQIRKDMPSNYDAEYMDYTNMIKQLQAI